MTANIGMVVLDLALHPLSIGKDIIDISKVVTDFDYSECSTWYWKYIDLKQFAVNR